QFERRRPGLGRSPSAIFLDQLEHALDATHSEFTLAAMDGIAYGSDVGSRLVRTGQQLKQLERRSRRAIGIADAMPATLAGQMLAQQLAGFRIKQTHEHGVPLHMYLTPYSAWRRSVVGRFPLNTAVQMDGTFAILVVTERLERKWLQEGLFFSGNRRPLTLGAAMDALVGPVFFPVIEVSLRLFQALELLALQWRLLRMGHTRFHFSFSIWIAHLAWQGRHSVVRQNVPIQGIQARIVEVWRQHALAKVVQNH